MLIVIILDGTVVAMFSIDWVKVNQIWLRTNLVRHLIKMKRVIDVCMQLEINWWYRSHARGVHAKKTINIKLYIQQQQQHNLFSQASWGRLEMKPGRNIKLYIQIKFQLHHYIFYDKIFKTISLTMFLNIF